MSRLRADRLTNKDGTGAPTFPNGVNITGVATASGGFSGSFTGDIGGNVTGNVTGDLTGNSTGIHTGNVTGDLTGNVTGNVTGNITGTAATFSGNVSVGGTLTYQDVTDIDSVGMVTARKGIQVLADGVNVVGTVTATTFVGDGSNLTAIASPNGNTISCVTASNCKDDDGNGRLPVFGGGNFQVFYSPGNFNTAGINCVRARAIGAGSYGCTSYWVWCCSTQIPCICHMCEGGVGGGYAHATVSSLPGGNVPVTVGTSWKCGSPTTQGDSKFWDKVCASGGIYPSLPGCGYADPTVVSSVCCSKGAVGACGRGGAAGSQIGDANPTNGCGSISGACNEVELSKQYPNRFPFDVFHGHCSKNSQLGQCNHFWHNGPPTCYSCNMCTENTLARIYTQPEVSGTGIVGGDKFVTFRNGANPTCCYCFCGQKGGQGGTGAGGGLGGCPTGNACMGGNGGLGGGGGNTLVFVSSCSCVSPGSCLKQGGPGGDGVVIVEW